MTQPDPAIVESIRKALAERAELEGMEFARNQQTASEYLASRSRLLLWADNGLCIGSVSAEKIKKEKK